MKHRCVITNKNQGGICHDSIRENWKSPGCKRTG